MLKGGRRSAKAVLERISLDAPRSGPDHLVSRVPVSDGALSREEGFMASKSSRAGLLAIGLWLGWGAVGVAEAEAEREVCRKREILR